MTLKMNQKGQSITCNMPRAILHVDPNKTNNIELKLSTVSRQIFQKGRMNPTSSITGPMKGFIITESNDLLARVIIRNHLTAFSKL